MIKFRVDTVLLYTIIYKNCVPLHVVCDVMSQNVSDNIENFYIMETKKEKYNGLKTQRITVESASLLDASRIQGATKSSNWHEERITETMGLNEISISSPSPSRDMSNSSYWQTDF